MQELVSWSSRELVKRSAREPARWSARESVGWWSVHVGADVGELVGAGVDVVEPPYGVEAGKWARVGNSVRTVTHM